MGKKLRVRDGLLPRLREIHRLSSEESQARLMGVSRSTLRRMEAGEQPSADFIVALCDTYGLGLGEAFEISAPRTASLVA
ncbi:helix-turn-helix transcriptional regulator [Arthrobacter sp. FW306-2-2C-D06B]|uniref:helix-turn-helix transcriptional regulator n=1 Tax=Arthrobacter sp. FW306-2-2C-D06B TaxID=2879618 RepID=UPI003FA47269|nr:helix-turn-helix domain-containing protein [Arthrobacter sp. FW306-2-2C-D06B]